MLRDQLMQHRDACYPLRQPTPGQHPASLVFDLDVMVGFSPIVPNKQHPAPSLTLINKPRTAERTYCDLMGRFYVSSSGRDSASSWRNSCRAM
jgi:hypothetical protein